MPFAWFRHGEFDIATGIWADASGTFGLPAILSGSGLTLVTEKGHGAVNEVTAIHGTQEEGSIKFGHVIRSEFTLCSVTRYTSADAGRKKRILNGEGLLPGQKSWYHGHWNGRAGISYYGGFVTSTANKLADDTDWLVMCGTNRHAANLLANGAEAGVDGQGDIDLRINSGWGMPGEASDFAVAELIVWDRALSEAEMRIESDRLHHLILGNPAPDPPPPPPPPSPPTPPLAPPLPPSPPLLSSFLVRLDASAEGGHVGPNAVNLASGQEWTMMGGGSSSCNRSTHLGVAVFDLDDPGCYLETSERLEYCGPRFGYTTATWLDWRDDAAAWRTLHRPEGGRITATNTGSAQLGAVAEGFRDSGATIDPVGWKLVVAVGQDTDCAADFGVGGTTTYYVGTPGGEPRAVGISDRSAASGRATFKLGDDGQGPGKVAETWAWNHALTTEQVHSFWAQTQAKYA